MGGGQSVTLEKQTQARPEQLQKQKQTYHGQDQLQKSRLSELESQPFKPKIQDTFKLPPANQTTHREQSSLTKTKKQQDSFKLPPANQTPSQSPKKLKSLEPTQNPRESPKKIKSLEPELQKNILDDLLPNQLSLKDLREQISRINLPVCLKGKNHSTIEFLCVDRCCQPVDQLKLLCVNCIQSIADEEISDHVHKDFIEVLLSLVNQVDPKRPQRDPFTPINGDTDVDECFNNLISRMQTHIQKCDKILKNIKTSFENMKNNRRENNTIVDIQEVKGLLEFISEDGTEKSLIKGLKQIKNYSVIYEDNLFVLNLHRAIDCKIQDKTGVYTQKFDRKLAELDKIVSDLSNIDILERGEDFQQQRENERNRIKKQISQEYDMQDQKKLEELRIIQNNMIRQEEEIQRQRQLAREAAKLIESSTLKNQCPPNESPQRLKQIQIQKELMENRAQMVQLMENHIKQCDNILCRCVEWGMETEYKYIGFKDDTIAEGRRKTTCIKGKDLNHQMKEIMIKLKLID